PAEDGRPQSVPVRLPLQLEDVGVRGVEVVHGFCECGVRRESAGKASALLPGQELVRAAVDADEDSDVLVETCFLCPEIDVCADEQPRAGQRRWRQAKARVNL